MNKFVSFEGIGYLAATFKVNTTAIEYLKSNYTNAQTGNVDVNGKKLAVKLNDDNTIGFGASSPTKADALLGILVAYEMDGFATVQLAGGVDEVPTKVELKSGRQSLGVNDKGQIEAISDGGARDTVVAQGSTSDNLFASIIL